MPTVIWQSQDSFDSKLLIYSEVAGILQGFRVFADPNYAYALTDDIDRVVQGSGIERNPVTVTPANASSADAWIMSHYYSEYNIVLTSVAMSTAIQTDFPLASGDLGGPSEMFTDSVPESASTWITQSGYPNRFPSDVDSPEFEDSPRFLIGFAGNTPEKVLVVPITGAILGTRYATNWTTLSSTAAVTDLEVVRII
jgi:hypothetical protein